VLSEDILRRKNIMWSKSYWK